MLIVFICIDLIYNHLKNHQFESLSLLFYLYISMAIVEATYDTTGVRAQRGYE